jgi:alcohol dehydrogenase
MRELTFVEAGKVEFRDKPEPKLGGAGEAIVRMLATSRCDLDFVIARGRAPISGPFALGHEGTAEVVDVGDAVNTVKPGDAVVVPFQIRCGTCARCKKDQGAYCAGVPKLASYGLAPMSGTEYGGLGSDLVRVPFADSMLVKLPPGVDPVHAAALSDNAVDGYRTVAYALAEEPNERVLVAGGGATSVGLYAVAAAKACGARDITYVDTSDARGAIATKLGATFVKERYRPDLRVGRFPITVDATARPEGLRFCMQSTDAGGVVTSAGIYFGEVPLDLLDMYTRGVRFVTSRVDARREVGPALELVRRGLFDLAPIVTNIVDADDMPAAWLESATKVVARHRGTRASTP